VTTRVVALVTWLVLVGPLALQAQAPPSTASAGDWRTFTGTWSATGKRQELPTGDGAVAAIERLSGSVVITVGEGVGRGFRGDMIGFDDGRVASVGRWVWTNERGDRIFGELKGEPVQAGRRFVGRITGGTGRFAGITGSLEFTWQSVVTTDEGTVQVRAVGLQGRYRPGSGLP
jgi:hypothetical protein